MLAALGFARRPPAVYQQQDHFFFSFNLESCIWETSYPVGFSPSSFHSILSIFWKQLFLIWQRCVQLQLKSVEFVLLRCSGFGKCSFNLLRFRSCREVHDELQTCTTLYFVLSSHLLNGHFKVAIFFQS